MVEELQTVACIQASYFGGFCICLLLIETSAPDIYIYILFCSFKGHTELGH